MIDGNKLGSVGFQKIGTPYSEMDCQAFVEWCLRQCGCSKDLAGSNAWYREVLKNGVILTPEECVKQLGKVPAGAFLFIHAFDGKEPAKYHGDGLGNASHIGICTIPRGEGAINSSCSRGCVCESKFREKTINGGWNKVGLWNQVEYDYSGGDTPAPGPEPEPTHQTAVVYAENGKPVNLRKRPGIIYALVDKVPCGKKVEVVEYGDDWSKVTYKGKTGYMMTKFLKVDTGETVSVLVPDISLEEAEALISIYPGAKIVEEVDKNV